MVFSFKLFGPKRFRFANMCCHGAKDTAIDDDCKISREGRMTDIDCDPYMESDTVDDALMADTFFYSDSDRDSDSDSENDNDKVIDLKIFCSDRSAIEADPFKRESELVYCSLVSDLGPPIVDSKSTTLEVVKVFCEARGKIKDDYHADATELKKKLYEYNSKFLQVNRSSAIALFSAACELRIKSLIDLMMEEVVSLFTKMEEVDVYNICFVNLKVYSDDLFERMKTILMEHPYDTMNRIFSYEREGVRAFWESKLISRKFHELESYDQRRLWLTAHFLLRRTYLSNPFRKLKAKDSVMQEGTPSQTMANPNISDIMKRKGASRLSIYLFFGDIVCRLWYFTTNAHNLLIYLLYDPN